MTEPPGEPPATAQSVASEDTPALAPGWYADPEDSGRQAYWNGTVWHRPKSSTSTPRTGPATDEQKAGGGRPGWLLPVVGVVVVVLVVAVAAFVATSRKAGSSGGASGAGSSGGAAAGPQATGPRVGTNGVTVVLPEGWEQVPTDEAGFKAFVDKAAKDSPDVVAAVSALHAKPPAGLSVVAVRKGDDGSYKSMAVVLSTPTPPPSATAYATQIENQLSASEHDVAVMTGKVAGHDAVFASYDDVSAAILPLQSDVYVLGPDGVAAVKVSIWESIDRQAAAKQIASTVSFG
jgi:hypothetical protein